MDPRSGMTPLYMVQTPPFSIEAPGCTPVEGETVPRRHPDAKDGLVERPAEGVDTLLDLLKRSADLYAGEPAIGSRKLLHTHKERKKVTKLVNGEAREVEKEWVFFELSDYAYITYQEYWTLISQLGSGLRKLGLDTGDKLHIFAATSAQWLAVSHASAIQAMTIVTAYDTLGESGVAHSLVQSEAKAMFVDPHLLKTVSGAMKNAESVRVLIYNNFDNQPVLEQQIEDFKSAHRHLTVLSYEEVRALGEENPVDPTPPSRDDIFCIMYTSGTTGPPKGVTVTHGAFISAVGGAFSVVGESVSHRERVLAYLPLAHIFEMVLENAVLFIGATMGYGSPRTLTDQSMRNCPSDMRAFRPTVMVGVPQVWETVRKGVVSRVDASGLLVRSLFWGWYAVKDALVARNLPGQSLLDGIVFSKVRDMTGGQLRFVFNGASGIAGGTARFLSLVLAPMISGYGLTETCCMGALGSPLQWTSDAIGTIPACVEVKLVSLPDLGYTTSSDPARGEIMIRGPAVAPGYYRNPEETSKAMSPDGWFRTGDIGEFVSITGHLRVVDRAKNLVKLLGGEYIALEKLEAVYRGAHSVLNIMVHGDSAHPCPVAVIAANEKVLKEMAARVGAGAGDEHAVHRDPRVGAEVVRELQGVGKQAGLSPLEMISGVVLVDDEWTPANGLVTATQKVNRRMLQEKYKKEIAECFAKSK